MVKWSGFPPRGAILVSTLTCILLGFASGRPLCKCENERPWHMSTNYGPYVAEKGHTPFYRHSPHYFNVNGHPPLAPNYHFPGWCNGEFSLKHKTPGSLLENPSEPDVVLPCGEKVPYALYESCVECYKKKLPLEIITSCGDIIPVSSYTELLLATKGNPEIRIQLPNGVIVSAGTYRALVSGYVDKTLEVQYPGDKECNSPVRRTTAAVKKVREPTVIMPSGERLSYKNYESIVRSNEERLPLRVLTPTEEKIVRGLTELILATQGRPSDLVLLTNGAIVTSKVFRDVINTRVKKNAVLILPSGLSMPLNSETLIPANELLSEETPNGRTGVRLPNGEEISRKVYDCILNSEIHELPKCVIKPSGEMIVVTTLAEILRVTEDGPYDVIELKDGVVITPGTYESAVRLCAEEEDINASQEVCEPSSELEPEREVSVILHGGMELPYDVYEAIMETYIHGDVFVVAVSGKAVPVDSLLELIAVTYGNPDDVITLPNGMHVKSSTFRGVINEHQQNDIFLHMPSGEMIPLSKGYDEYIHAVHKRRETDYNSSPMEGFVTVGSGEKIAFPLYETIISSSCSGKPIFVLDPDGSVLTVRTLPELWQLVDRHPEYLIRLPGEILVPADTYRQAVHSRLENAEIIALVCGSNIKPLSDSSSAHSVVMLADQETIPYHLYKSIINSYENRTPLKTTTSQAQYVYVYPLVELMLVTKHRPNALVFLQNGDVTTAHTYRDAVITHTQGRGKLLYPPKSDQPEQIPVVRCQPGHDRCNFVRITVPGRGVQFILGDGSWDSPKYCRIECGEGKVRYQPADSSSGLSCYESLVRPDGKVVYIEAPCPQFPPSTLEDIDGEEGIEPAIEQESSEVTEATPEHNPDKADRKPTQVIDEMGNLHTSDIHRPHCEEEGKVFSEEAGNQLVTDSSSQPPTTDVEVRPFSIIKPSSIATFEELPCLDENEESSGEPRTMEDIDGYGQIHTIDVGNQPVSITKSPIYVSFGDTPLYGSYPRLTEKPEEPVELCQKNSFPEISQPGATEPCEDVPEPSVEPCEAIPEEPIEPRRDTPEISEPCDEDPIQPIESSEVNLEDPTEPCEVNPEPPSAPCEKKPVVPTGSYKVNPGETIEPCEETPVLTERSEEPVHPSELSEVVLEEPTKTCEDSPVLPTESFKEKPVPQTESSEVILEEPIEPCEDTPEPLTAPCEEKPVPPTESYEVNPEETIEPCEETPALTEPSDEEPVHPSEPSEIVLEEPTKTCEDSPVLPTESFKEMPVPQTESSEVIAEEPIEPCEDTPEPCEEKPVRPTKSYEVTPELTEPCDEDPVPPTEYSEVILEEPTKPSEHTPEPSTAPCDEKPIPPTETFDVIPEEALETCEHTPELTEAYDEANVFPSEQSEVILEEPTKTCEDSPVLPTEPCEGKPVPLTETLEVISRKPTDPCEDTPELSEPCEEVPVFPIDPCEVISEESTEPCEIIPELLGDPCNEHPATPTENSEIIPEEPIGPCEDTPELIETCDEDPVPSVEPCEVILQERTEPSKDTNGLLSEASDEMPSPPTDLSEVIAEEPNEPSGETPKPCDEMPVLPTESSKVIPEDPMELCEDSPELTEPSEEDPALPVEPPAQLHTIDIGNKPVFITKSPIFVSSGDSPLYDSYPKVTVKPEEPIELCEKISSPEMTQPGATEPCENVAEPPIEPFEAIPEEPIEPCEDTPERLTAPCEELPELPIECSEVIPEEPIEPCEETPELTEPSDEDPVPPSELSEVIPQETTESCEKRTEHLTEPCEENPVPPTEPCEVISEEPTEPCNDTPEPCEFNSYPSSSADISSVRPHAPSPHGEGSQNMERYHESRSPRKYKRKRKPVAKKHNRPVEDIIQDLPEVRPTYTPVYDDNNELVSFVRSDLLTDNKYLHDVNAPVDSSCGTDGQPHIIINRPNKVVHDSDGNMFVFHLNPDGSIAYDSESIALKPVTEDGGSTSPTSFHFPEIEDWPCPSSDPGYIIVRTADGHINYIPSVAAPVREITLPSGKKFVVPVFPSKFLEPSVPYHSFTTPDGFVHEVPYGRGRGNDVESSMISIEKIETADGSTVEIPVETHKRCDGSITTSVTYSPNGKTKYKTIVDVSGDVYSIPISGSTTHLHPRSKPYKTIIDLKGDEYHVPEGQIKSSAYKTIIDVNGNIYEIPATIEPVDNTNHYHNTPAVHDPTLSHPELAATQYNPALSFGSKDYLRPFFYPKSYHPSQVPHYDRVMAHIYQDRSCLSDQQKPCGLSESGTPLTVVPYDDRIPENVPHYYYPPHPLLYNYRTKPVTYNV